MYHVAPLLPYFEKDLQQLERKRHVGNDVVNVVFVEGSQPKPTGLITSHFTYVFIVVRLESMSPPRFRVAVCAKDGVRPFGPPLPDPPVFDANQSFSDWMSAKLVNAERANQLLVESIDQYRAIIKSQSGVPSSSVLRSFLQTLKAIGGSQEMRSFITGIMPLALADALGYNVAKVPVAVLVFDS